MRRENDPFGAYNFLVESNGVLRAGFSEVTGLTSESDPIDYREGTDDTTMRRLTGLKKFGNVTLKRGVATGQDLLEWRKRVTDGQDNERLDLAIVLLDEARREQIRFNLSAAWPCKWSGPELKAGANEIAVESVELCHEGVTLG